MRFTLYIDSDRAGSPTTWRELCAHALSAIERMEDHVELDKDIRLMPLMKITSWDGYYVIGGYKVSASRLKRIDG